MSAPAVTHVSVYGVQRLVGADTGPSNDLGNLVLACDWSRTWEPLRGGPNIVFAQELRCGARPTCPECCVHLDAALEMAEGAKP